MTSALANWYPGHWVLDFCVIVAAAVILVTATAWMVSLFLKRHPAVRHLVLLSALMASLASPLFAWGFIASGRSFINVPLLIAEDTALAPELPDEVNPFRNRQAGHGHARFVDEPAASAAPEAFLPTDRTGLAKSDVVRDNVATADPKSPTVDPATGSSDPFRSAVVAVLLMWLCGTLVVILGLFRGVLLLRRLCRSVRPMTDTELGHALDEARRRVGGQSSPAIGVSSLARSPLVAGLFRPIIVIPRILLGAIRGHELRDILMHEIAHVERHDNLVVLLQAIAKAAFWPIPFLHLLNRELERAREEICDNHVLACRDAVSYGETLLRVAHLACETEMPVGTVGILHWRGKLEDRIFGLVHTGRSKMTRLHPLIALGVLALFLAASAILCGTTIVAAQPPQTASDKPAAAQEQPVAPQKSETAQEKEAFTAWGKEVGGLQAGLGYRPGEHRAYHHDETVTLVVRIRNVGNEDVKFRYLKEFFMETPPTVTGGEGKTIRHGGLDLLSIAQVPVDVNLAPGKEFELHDLKLKLAPASGSGDVTEVSPETLNGKGVFQIRYEQLAAASIDPNLAKLATGKLELEVKEAAKAETPKFIKVTGQLLDDATGKPIELAYWELGIPDSSKPDGMLWGFDQGGQRHPDGKITMSLNVHDKGVHNRARVSVTGYETTVVVGDLPQPLPGSIERIVRLKRIGKTVSGTVRDHQGKPAAGAQVYFIPKGHRAEIAGGYLGPDLKSWPIRPRQSNDPLVAETVADAEGRFTLPLPGPGTLAASTQQVDVWPFSLPADGQPANLTMPAPASLVVDLDEWRLDGLYQKSERVRDFPTSDPDECWMTVRRHMPEVAAAVAAEQPWASLEYERKMLIFAPQSDPRLSRDVAVGKMFETSSAKAIPGMGFNKRRKGQIRVALPPGKYSLARLHDGPLGFTTFVLKPGEETIFDQWKRPAGAAVRGTVKLPENMQFVRQPGEAPRKLDWTIPYNGGLVDIQSNNVVYDSVGISGGSFIVPTHLPPGKYTVRAFLNLPRPDLEGFDSGKIPQAWRDLGRLEHAPQELVIPEPAPVPAGPPPVEIELVMKAVVGKQIVAAPPKSEVPANADDPAINRRRSQ